MIVENYSPNGVSGHSFRFTSQGETNAVFIESVIDLTAFTVCLWMRTNNKDRRGIFVSYTLREENRDNALSLGNYKNLKLTINNAGR